MPHCYALPQLPGRGADLQKYAATLVLLIPILAFGSAASIEKARQTRKLRCDLALLKSLEPVVESELPFSPNLFKLITTTDGTLSPLFRKRPAPQWIRDLSRKLGYKGPGAILWDELTYQEQVAIVRHSVYDQNFVRVRQVTGLKVKPEVLIHLDEPKVLFDATYPPGTYKIDTTRFLFPEIELKDPVTNDARGFELHFRWGDSLAFLFPKVWDFLESVGIPKRKLHGHSLARLHPFLRSLRVFDKKRVSRKTKSELIGWAAFLKTEFARRADLIFQFVEIMEEGGPGRLQIRSLKHDEKIYSQQSILTLTQLTWIYRHFLGADIHRVARTSRDMARRKKLKELWLTFHPLTTVAKTGYVGFRGYDFYKSPELWGMEARMINPLISTKVTHQIIFSLEALQKLWTGSLDYGIDSDKLESLITKVNASAGTASVRTIFSLMHYNWYQPDPLDDQGMARVMDSASLLKEIVRGELPKDKDASQSSLIYQIIDLQVELTKKFPDRPELKMLYHDWSWDPLFFDNENALGNIKLAQEEARASLEALGNNAANDPAHSEKLTSIMRTFLCKSGIYHAYLKSIQAAPIAQNRCEELSKR